MTRNVGALYDTRAQAEVARARLSSQFDAGATHILGRDDTDTLDGFDLADVDRRAYREALGEGSILLLAKIPGDKDPEQIVSLLQDAAETSPLTSASEGRGRSREPAMTPLKDELRIGHPIIERGGAVVRGLTRDAEQNDVDLQPEQAKTVSPDRLSLDEAEAAGLLKNRVVEISSMCEEPVLHKQAFVREEIVLRKTSTERTVVVDETVRRTKFAVEELAPDFAGRDLR